MEIKIWLGDLGAYNAGKLVGEWLALPMDSDELQAKIDQYTDNGRGDYFIADHECEIPALVKESSDPLKLNELAEEMADLRDDEITRVKYLLGQGYDADDALAKYEDVQFYPDMTLRQVAEQLVDDGCFGDIPDSIANYIDYEAIGRDLGMDGYDETPEGVFRID
jgi:antirestriction protein